MTTYTLPEDHTDLAPVMARVRKLLALATSANPHEAAAAAAKAQALMFRHSLTIEGIQAARGADDSDEYRREEYPLDGAKAGQLNWRRLLVSTVALHNFCHAVSYTGTARMALVGKPHDLALVKHLVAYLTREIDRLARAGWDTLPAWEKAESHPLTWRDAFRKGAVVAVSARLSEQRRRDEATVPPESRALVVRHDERAQAAKDRYFPNTRRADYARVRASARDAYREGVRAGHGIPLSTPVMGPQLTALPVPTR